MYERILVATDGSELAGRAVEHGLNLAKSVGAKVIILTVSEHPSVGEAAFGELDSIKAYEDAASKSADEILENATAQADILGVVSETLYVKDQKPAKGILETAEKVNCDLIIMASNGRRGLQKMLVGSQTTEVLAASRRPVLVLR